MATNIRPYKIAVSPADVQRLKQKLSDARLPEGEEDDWSRGPPVQTIRRIARHWEERFDWPTFESRLNELPNYEATIALDGFKSFQVHFVHQKSPDADAVPLLFVHGWPGSFYEVSKILPILREGKGDSPAFHVVAPSLPNFGFSDGIYNQPGFGMKQYAETCHQIMQGLGYTQYASQGGDWGSTITRVLGTMYPDSLRAIHLNLIVATPPPLKTPVSFLKFIGTHILNWYTPQEALGLQKAMAYQAGNGNGYYEMQKQKPTTIGFALADSPVALLAWIYDKLVAWTDDYPWTDSEVCEWVSLYWFSRAGPAASVVIYHEASQGEIQASASHFNPGTKVGFSYFPKEMFRTPRLWNTQLGDVVFEREHERGGHFAAWEQADALASDLKVMFAKDGSAMSALHKDL